MATAGVEVTKYKYELLPILHKIAEEHEARCDACELPEDAAEQALAAIADVFEGLERPKRKAAA